MSVLEEESLVDFAAKQDRLITLQRLLGLYQ